MEYPLLLNISYPDSLSSPRLTLPFPAPTHLLLPCVVGVIVHKCTEKSIKVQRERTWVTVTEGDGEEDDPCVRLKLGDTSDKVTRTGPNFPALRFCDLMSAAY